MFDIGPLDLIELPTEDTVSTSQNNLLFVGVMTSKDFLHDRAKAVYETWGREVPGRLAFFSSEGSYADGMPVVALKGVDDRYPPQKKSFRMLYYMYEHFIDRFEWFARADDDVYVNTHKLEKFLRSIDSSKPQFIGKLWFCFSFQICIPITCIGLPQVKRDEVTQRSLVCCPWSSMRTSAWAVRA